MAVTDATLMHSLEPAATFQVKGEEYVSMREDVIGFGYLLALKVFETHLTTHGVRPVRRFLVAHDYSDIISHGGWSIETSRPIISNAALREYVEENRFTEAQRKVLNESVAIFNEGGHDWTSEKDLQQRRLIFKHCNWAIPSQPDKHVRQVVGVVGSEDPTMVQRFLECGVTDPLPVCPCMSVSHPNMYEVLSTCGQCDHACECASAQPRLCVGDSDSDYDSHDEFEEVRVEQKYSICHRTTRAM